MKLVRVALFLYGLITILGSIYLFAHIKTAASLILPVYLLINATISIAVSLFEEKRYKSKNKF